jgi:hypothetical protein
MICGIVALVRLSSSEGRGQGLAAAGARAGLWDGALGRPHLVLVAQSRHAHDLAGDTYPALTHGTLDRAAVDSAPPVIRRAFSRA